ncbi:MAG: bifunctional [glutamate--ammonia ligase]-adenylyl-L-tyrosine phosphorylase/[glutamate--ammonia-ligase] adenylyltransferase [Lysobacteraceae bacterium]
MPAFATPEIDALLEQQLARLAQAAPVAAAQARAEPARFERLARLLIASDYALERLCRDPELVDALEAPSPGLHLDPADESQWPARIRRYRHAQSIRLIHRDVNGIDTIEDTLRGASELAQQCLASALEAVRTSMELRHGVPRDAQGNAQQLIVFGLGKLGGGELNFSSDIDLVFAYPESGQSDGERPLDNAEYFTRLGQRLIKLLADVDADGMAFRVDMRLRPFGQVGRLALSFTAMEQYFQREGRDWERYAWIKARPVAGDIAQGEHFLTQLRPFIYRRYLDFGALEGLREMKAMIEAEVARRERERDLKLGRGGIREIEFLVQVQQLIRGGREPDLRQRGLIAALARLRERGHLPDHSAEVLLSSYRFLRRLENRVQMLREEQTHQIPDAPLDRARLAFGSGFTDWPALEAALESHRAHVAREFAQVFQARTPDASSHTTQGEETLSLMANLWRQPGDETNAEKLAAAGFDDAPTLAQKLADFARLPALAVLSERTRKRVDRLLPALLVAAAKSRAPRLAAERALALVQAVLRRSSYLALLDERPDALARLIEVLAGSRWMAERLCAHPLLLDELLDARSDANPPTRDEICAALTQSVAHLPQDDPEARLLGLNEFRQGISFRIARASLIDRQPPLDSSAQLAWLAQAVVGDVLPMAQAEVVRQHGNVHGGLAAIAYGSFGGAELGFDSDLDLVFLYAADPKLRESDGARPLEPSRWHTRVVQKTLSLLDLQTTSGRLYEADLRLRPDGGKGLLVSSLESFTAYQRERAWVWEQQALVRARPVAGDAQVAQRFADIRAETLCRKRDAVEVRREVAKMRQRMRAEKDRSTGQHFDLKQGVGGLVDLEFLVQAGVLIHAHAHPRLIEETTTQALMDALGSIGWFDADTVRALHEAHSALLARALACTLDGRSRLVSHDVWLVEAREVIAAAWQARLPAAPLS